MNNYESDDKKNENRQSKPDNQKVLRGNKFDEYTVKEPVDQEYYSGEIWNPIPNERLIGRYIDSLSNVGKFNQTMYIIDGNRLDGMYDKIFGCTSLDRQMKEIAANEVIEIKYIGKNHEKGYHEYQVSRLRKQHTIIKSIE